MTRHPFIAAVLAAALCGCQSENDGPPPRTQASPASTAGSDCGADKLDRWLNLLPTETAKAEIADAAGERPIRYYTQGDPITMDFNPARLNVELGADGRIKLFRCG